jgi:hypothetical protein
MTLCDHRVMARTMQITIDAAHPSELRARAAELVELGATHVAEFDEPEGHWITMRDPEGNEFCLH